MKSISLTKPIFALMIIAIICVCCGIDGDPKIYYVGEIAADQNSAQANGELAIETTIQVSWFYLNSDKTGRLSGLYIKLTSNRNGDGATVDVIEQPISPTDIEGKTIAHIGSSTAGEVILEATYDGVQLCGFWTEDRCDEAAREVITFYD